MNAKNKSEMRAFGLHVRKVREDLHLDRYEFAKLLGIAPPTLQGVELGNQNLGAAACVTLERIARGEEPRVSQAQRFTIDDIERAVIMSDRDDIKARAEQVKEALRIPIQRALAMVIHSELTN